MMRTLSGNLALAVLLIGGVVRAADPPTFPAAATADEWAKTFQTPPDQARPWVYWMFMDGNLTREGMTADLEAMKRAGIGGAIILEVNIGIPRGTVLFMSEPWRQLLKHAIHEADRLGLEIALVQGRGGAAPEGRGSNQSNQCSISSPARRR